VERAGWAGVAACVGLALVGAAVFRVDIVDTWPRAAGAYAAVGLEVNPYGLEVGSLLASFEGGELVVEGIVDNITGGVRTVMPLNAQVLDGEGHVLHQWPVILESHELPGHGSERFRTVLAQVPEGAVRVEVVIADPADPAQDAPEHAAGADDDTAHGDAHDDGAEHHAAAPDHH